MERYEAYVSLSFEVHDADALRSAAKELVLPAGPGRADEEIWAERATATPEKALSVLIGMSQQLSSALQELATSVPGLRVIGQYSSPDDVRRLDS
jgi:hypothetical protein